MGQTISCGKLKLLNCLQIALAKVCQQKHRAEGQVQVQGQVQPNIFEVLDFFSFCGILKKYEKTWNFFLKVQFKCLYSYAIKRHIW